MSLRFAAVGRRTLLQAVTITAALGAAACGSSSPSANPTAPTTANVTALTVTSASSSPSSFQLIATARLSDGTTRDVTTSATWESSNAALATVSASGLVTVVGTGELDVKATYQGATGSLHLLVAKLPVVAVTVTGAPSAALVSFQLTATARLSDGSTLDVTRSATWESSNTAVATVSSAGFVSVVANGDADVRATYQGATASTHVKVTLPKMYTIAGVVSEAAPNARPVSGARVQIIGSGFATTNDQGAYTLTAVPEGRALVETSKTGYQVSEKEVILSGDTQLMVTLFPTPPANADGATATARCNDGTWSWAQTRADACTANGGIAYGVCPGVLCAP